MCRCTKKGCATSKHPTSHIPRYIATSPHRDIATWRTPLSNLNVNLTWLGFFAHRQLHRQHAVLVLGADAAAVDRRRQRERPHEAAIGALDAVEVLLLDLVIQLALAANRERVVLDGDVDVFTLHVGQL